MHTLCMHDSGTGMQDTGCTGRGLGPWLLGGSWQHVKTRPRELGLRGKQRPEEREAASESPDP